MIHQNEAIVFIFHSGHEYLHYSSEIVLILFEDVEKMVGLIRPKAIFLLDVSDYFFVILLFILSVVFHQGVHQFVELGLGRLRLGHVRSGYYLFVHRCEQLLVFYRFT